MPPVGFEPTISEGERPKTYALDRAATGTGNMATYTNKSFDYGQRKFKVIREIENGGKRTKLTRIGNLVL